MNNDGYSYKNTIEGGTGDDTIFLNAPYGISISDSSGNDTLDLSNYSKGSIVFGKSNDDLLILNNKNSYEFWQKPLVIEDWFVSDDNKIENFIFSDGTMTSDEINPMPFIGGDNGDNELAGSDDGDIISGEIGNDTILGGAGNDLIYGGNGNDVLKGQEGIDTVYGGAGDDEIWNNSEVNYFYGGVGDDKYYLDSFENIITEYKNEGTDEIISSVSHTLEDNIENLTLSGFNAINATGNSLGNILTGNSTANILDGSTGADTMLGGDGNDTYYIDNISDVVIENAGEGIDTVNSSITYTLGTNLENFS